MTRSKQGREECNAAERCAVHPFLKAQTAGRTPPRPARRSQSTPAQPGAGFQLRLVPARCGLSGAGLRSADVTSHFVLGNLVDHQFQWAAVVALMEEDRLVHRHILLVDVYVVDDQRDAVALLV